jgi:uncharacterized protein
MTDNRPLALVTGGSSGIGFELAKQFAQNRFDVAISGSSDKVHKAAEALRELGSRPTPSRPMPLPSRASKASGPS